MAAIDFDAAAVGAIGGISLNSCRLDAFYLTE
jgi:hypothetical protein